MIAEKEVERFKKVIDTACRKNDFNGAMAALELCAELRYRDNQILFEQELEEWLARLAGLFDPILPTDKNENTVLFYDGFGLEKRGLSYIYVNALLNLGYTVVYVLDGRHKTYAAQLEERVRQSAGVVYRIESRAYDVWCGRFAGIIKRHRPAAAFLYTSPYDTAGIVSFQRCGKAMKTFLINSTDQEYWLGTKATDYVIEFRDYGASLSFQYRKIAADRLVKLPFYPYTDEILEFQGYPSECRPGQLIVFSGGQLYKTRDKKQTYYKIVRYVLKKHENVVFWYARGGDAPELKRLQEEFPDRVWHTGERPDLLEVLKHCDIYLNTYPIAGGLMMQYSAQAGRLPVGLRTVGDEADDILINQEQHRIFFDTVDELKEELDLLITDPAYRAARNHEIKNGTVIQENEFATQLDTIIKKGSSDYKIEIKQYDVQAMLRVYREMNRGIGPKLYYKSSRQFLLRYEFLTIAGNLCLYILSKGKEKVRLLK